MLRRGLACACLIALCGACHGFDGFASFTVAEGGSRLTGASSFFTPRFPGSGGLFLAFEGLDDAGNLAVFAAIASTRQSDLVSRPSDPESDAFPAIPFADDDSFGGTVTGTGSAIAFLSRATNLLPLDADVFPIPDRFHAYVRDLATGRNELVSRNPETGRQANAHVTSAMISANGRFVVFATAATNLDSRATNGLSHIYVYDLFLDLLQLITFRPDGFAANGASHAPVITPDGRFVAFETHATDLLPGDTNGERDIYLFDRSTRVFERISFDVAGGETLLDPREATISANGLFVAFSAEIAAGDPRQILRRDRTAMTTALVSKSAAGFPGSDESRAPSLGPDGIFLAFETDATNFFAADTGATTDIFVYDAKSDSLTILTLGLEGEEADGSSFAPSLSPDGLSVAFSTFATNLFMLNPARGEEENALADILVLPNPALP